MMPRVDEAARLPATCKLAPMDDEALLMKPFLNIAKPVNVGAPAVVRVPDAKTLPELST